jgi:hypothetical protein
MRDTAEELTVIDKAYDLVLWSCRHIAKFPRSFRFTLGQHTEMRLYAVLELLLKAKYKRDKKELLRQANMELELLRFQFRLAKDLQCLNVKSYEYAAREVDEIGRMVGGWLKRSDTAGGAKR